VSALTPLGVQDVEVEVEGDDEATPAVIRLIVEIPTIGIPNVSWI